MAKANKHLDHLEDRIILEGSQGGKDAIDVLKKMGDMLSGKPGPGVTVTTKWDGAPAVVCGIDPEDGNFFVGTKSVFAKDAKICKTQEDIVKFYGSGGGLAEKLSVSLRYLPSSVKQGILQGDLMFTNDKKTEKIDGQNMITFRPNTITYAANPNTQLGKDINRAKIGIVFHTKYTGNKMSDLQASFNVSKNDFTTGGDVWAERAEFQDISNVASFSVPERNKYDAAIRMAEGSLKQASRMTDMIQSGKKPLKLDTEFMKFFNSYVKQGRDIPSVQKAYDDYNRHLNDEFNKAFGKVKTAAAVSKKATMWAEEIFFILKHKDDVKMLIAAYMNLQKAKMILVEKMKKVSSLRLFVDRGGGDYEATTPEGFVAIVNDKATKLVDRMEFSKLNFTIPKVW
jgi:hypothetical protein